MTDVTSGMRMNLHELAEMAKEKKEKQSWLGAPYRAMRALI